MRTMRIEIRTLDQVLGDFRQAFTAAVEGKPYPKRERVSFASLEAARNLLTPERVKLLMLIRQRHPASVYELAQLSERDFKNVYDDVELLERHGLLRTDRRSPHERLRRIPHVEYDEIVVQIPLNVAEEPVKSWNAESQALPDYRAWQSKFMPRQIKWVFVAESPPSDLSRYFYFERVSNGDSLFLELMRVLYPQSFTSAKAARAEKVQFLTRFRDDGCLLMDVVNYPLGELGPTGKRRRLREHLPRLINELRAGGMEKARLILIGAPVYEVCAEPLRDAGFAILNTESIDFPGSGRQLHFRRKLGELLRRHGWPLPRSGR